MSHLVSGSVVGPYRIGGMLGRGGMATVYEATHESLGRSAALKLLDPRLGSGEEFLRRFRREARAQASLEHPHVVAVYEIVESPEGLFIAMQLVRGPTLASLIAGGALTAPRAMALLGQVAAAVDAAHEAGMVHRDIKPRNVLVDADDHAYLADFGLSRLGDETAVTLTGDVLGTVAYLAPEIILGEGATAASDRYAFAALAFECLTGSVVFPRPTQAAQLHAHTSEPVPRISVRRDELPATLDDVFARALAKAPGDRPASAADLVAEIRRAAGEERLAELGPPVPLRALQRDADGSTMSPVPPLAASSVPVAAHPPAARRSRWRVAAAIAAAAIVGAGLGATAARDDDGPGVLIPALLAGTTGLGSDLTHAGATRDCAGRAVRGASVDCSILQARLPGHAVVVPRDGLVRRWAVRDAAGELQLQVLRSRDAAYHQLAVSRSEFVADGQVHAFPTDLAVEAGDLLSVHVVSGSGVGVRPAPGGTILRWLPRLKGDGRTPSPGAAGLAGELLLRIEFAAGAKQTLPTQVTGAAAAKLPNGRLVRRRLARPPGGRQLDLRIVEIGSRIALDLFFHGRRLARMDLPGFVAGVGKVVLFDTYVNAGDPDVEVTLEYQRLDSARRLSHYVSALPREFFYVN
jgi:hypothetical protein